MTPFEYYAITRLAYLNTYFLIGGICLWLFAFGGFMYIGMEGKCEGVKEYFSKVRPFVKFAVFGSLLMFLFAATPNEEQAFNMVQIDKGANVVGERYFHYGMGRPAVDIHVDTVKSRDELFGQGNQNATKSKN